MLIIGTPDQLPAGHMPIPVGLDIAGKLMVSRI
jgi:hypothetical protein